MSEGFLFQGAYRHSSDIPHIVTGGQSVSRPEFWQTVIDSEAAKLPAGGGKLLHVETGGGYGAFDGLIDHEKSRGLIPVRIPVIRGDMFRDLGAFREEKEAVRTAITDEMRRRFSEDYPVDHPEAVNQVLRAFYSHEINTHIAKEIVKAALKQHKSCAYESAGLYEDIVERARLAKERGMKTVLVAGDKDHTEELTRADIQSANMVQSYKKFAGRFETELAEVFDEVRLYANDEKTPRLIAEKREGGQLEVLDKRRYAEFAAKQFLDPATYERGAISMDAVHQVWQERENRSRNRGS